MTDPMNQWLATGTVRSATVKLYSDQLAVERLMSLYSDLDEAKKSAAAGQRALGEKSVIAELEMQIDALEDEVAQSRSVWTLRALTRAEIKACNDKHPDPEAPVKPYTQEALDEYRKGALEAGEMRTLEIISKSIKTVEFATETVTAVPVEALKAMLDAEYGDFRIGLLVQAHKDASSGEKGMPRPKS